MRILHLLASNKFSGAEHIAVDIIRALQEKYELVYVSPTGEIKEFLGQEKIRYIPLNELSYLEVYRVIKDYKPDIIHAHDYRASCIAAFCCYGRRFWVGVVRISACCEKNDKNG